MSKDRKRRREPGSRAGGTGPSRPGGARLSRAGAVWLPRAEWASAILLTLLAAVFCAAFAIHAGALWRDEVNSADFAAMPSLSSVGESLQYDSFPLLSTLALRGWSLAGLGHADWGFRLFGFLVGVAFLGALWLASRLLGASTPVLSLALVGLNPWVIRTVCSVRPYGLGVVLILLTMGLMWRALDAPTPRRFLAAGALAVLSVQCMYQNAFLLLAICAAAGIAALRASRPKLLIGLAGVGIAAALSLLPYLGSIAAARSWSAVAQSPATWKHLLEVLVQTLASGGEIVPWIWLGLAALCLVLGGLRLWKRAKPRPPAGALDPALGSAAFLIVGTVVFLAAIKGTRLPSQPWYYVPLLALLAPALEAGVGVLARGGEWRMGKIALAFLIAISTALPAWKQSAERWTNVDAVASYLQREASPGDAIVVFPFYFGVSFQRYYKGAAPWMTVPPVEDLKITRYDLVKTAMTRSDPMKPVLDAMAGSLGTGHRVWLVGGLPAPDLKQPAPTIPPAPHPTSGWSSGPYLITWGEQGYYFLAMHALKADPAPIPQEGPVGPYERLSLFVASGWR